MCHIRSWLVLLITLCPMMLAAQDTAFNADSAYAFTRHLSVAIGPRPMGSADDRAALNWAVEKFRNFGADSAYVLTFSEARSRRGVTNTNSGVAVGLFRGRSDSTIVIGGHIDSAGREIPGANDDASGTATMMELSRVWSTRARRYTMLFAAFSGEEQGLIGSKYFVEHYPKIDNVALMLQIDMVGSLDDLILFLETKKHEAPRWLVEDAFAFERTLGFRMLRYPTHFFSLNQAVGGAGSDHMPFLDKGIPAIDFTAGVNNSPIHTPEDKFEFVSKTVMDKSGRLIDNMLQKYQSQGIPTAREGDYVLWQVLGGRLFIPSWLVSATSGVAVLLGIWAFFFSRKRRLRLERAARVRFSGFKLFAVIILIAGAAQAGEAVMQAIKGLRYPWLVPVDKYLWLAGLCTLAGIWVALQLTRRWRFSPDPYVYSKRAVLLLLVFVFLLAAGSLRLAVYPALTLLLLSLAIFVPSPLVKSLLAILAPLPMFRLMFMEVLPFVFRNAITSGFGILSFASALLYTAALTAILVLWFLPAVFTYAYAVVTVGPLKNALKTVRAPAVGLLLLLGVVGYGGYLFSFPAYNDMWRAMIHVDATFDANTGESSLKLVGNEYFRNVDVTADSLTRHYDARLRQASLPIGFAANWLDIHGEERLATGEHDTVTVDWVLASTRPWYQTTLTLSVDTLSIEDVDAVPAVNHKGRTLRFNWFADPPDTLRVHARFTISPRARLIREVKAVYPEMPVPLQVTAELADVRYRTTVVRRDTMDFRALRTTAK